MTIKALSICSGHGGLDMALQALGVQTVGYVEWDPYAQAVLHARMRDGRLDSAPIWGDLTALTGAAVLARCGDVDIVYGGIPCQPHSTAGKRAGADDARDLWPATRRLLGELRPRIFLLENVAGFSTRSGDEPAFAWGVLADLAALGYMGRWTHLRAANAGAPHSRRRFFCLAYTDQGRPGAGASGEPALARDGDATLADAGHRAGGTEQREQQAQRTAGVGERGGTLGGPARRSGDGPTDPERALRNAHQQGLEGREQPVGGGGNQWPAFPPGPEDDRGWAAYLDRWPNLAPSVERPVRGGADGVAVRLDKHRRQRLEGLGNGVVPHQALLALNILLGAQTRDDTGLVRRD